MSPARYIAIEGPLRVGKSSLAQALAERIHANTLLDSEENPFLKDFYRGQHGSAFRAQMYFLVNRFRQLSAVDPSRSQTPVVADYLFEKDKLFAYINLNDDEVAVYDQYYRHFKEQLASPDLVVYLKATPQVLRERIVRKNVASEAQHLRRVSCRSHPCLRTLLCALQGVRRLGRRHNPGRLRTKGKRLERVAGRTEPPGPRNPILPAPWHVAERFPLTTRRPHRPPRFRILSSVSTVRTSARPLGGR